MARRGTIPTAETQAAVDWGYVIEELKSLGFVGEEIYQQISENHTLTEDDSEKINEILDIF